MSVFSEDGSRRIVFPPQMDFVQTALRDWVDGDPDRATLLAALTLRTAGWSYDEIATVLGGDRSRSRKRVEAAKKALRRRFPDALTRFPVTKEQSA